MPVKAAVVVQARITSTRLPGKTLLELGGMTVLAQVLRRCAAIDAAVIVCCAIPAASEHDGVAVEAKKAGAVVVRGPEDDVLARYALAARQVGAIAVIRVTSDCPLIDPDLCKQVLAPVIAGEADYACNNMPPSWPHGLDCEAFTSNLLETAAREAVLPFEREHVTPWMRNKSGIRRVNVANKNGRGVEERWTLDFPEDLVFLRRLFAMLPAAPAIPSTADVLDVLERHPELTSLNSIHRGKSRPALSPVP